MVLGRVWRPPPPQAFATNANSNNTNSSSSTSLSAKAGVATAGDATTPSVAAAAAALAAAARSSGGGSGGGSGRPVFHEHILQALDSLRQRNVAVFSSAVGNARALALARLGSGGGASQEGGKGLYPCLVQLQCVAEMEEAFEMLSSSGAAGATGAVGGGEERGSAVDDAVRGRLRPPGRLGLCYIFTCIRQFQRDWLGPLAVKPPVPASFGPPARSARQNKRVPERLLGVFLEAACYF